jgi:hypothetical protein
MRLCQLTWIIKHLINNAPIEQPHAVPHCLYVRDLPFKRIHLVWATTDEDFRPTISHRHGGREADK